MDEKIKNYRTFKNNYKTTVCGLLNVAKKNLLAISWEQVLELSNEICFIAHKNLHILQYILLKLCRKIAVNKSLFIP